MAEPKSAESSRAAQHPEETPKLVAVPEGPPGAGTEPASEAAEPTGKGGVSRILFAVVVLLLLLALGGLYAQSRHASAQAERIAALGNQVEGLEVQLSAANTQIATYDMQLSLVQVSVADMYEKMGGLLELVNMPGFDPAPAEPLPEPR